MSKHDFTKEEFADRLQRTRAAIAAGRPRLAPRDPSGVDALADRTGQQELHGLSMSRRVRPSPTSSSSSRARWSATSSSSTPWSNEVRSYNGREPEDPMEAFSKFADELGLKNARVGMEVPSWYLNPHQYVRVKEILGDALVAEPSNLVHSLKLVKSPRRSNITANPRPSLRMPEGAALQRSPERTHGARAGRRRLSAILKSGSAIPASTMNLMTGERSCFVLGAPTERKQASGRHGTGRARRRLPSLHLDARTAMGARQAERAPARSAQDRARGVRRLHGGDA